MKTDNMVIIFQITIAADDVAGMVILYNTAFGCILAPFEATGFNLYEGHLAGIVLILCPNEMLGIAAEKNRQQVDLEVADIAATVGAALEAGVAGIEQRTLWKLTSARSLQ